MAQVGGHIQGLLDQGVQVLTWSDNDQDTSERANYDFFAIWTFPNQEMADGFQQLVTGAGWYTYFEQVNIKGEANTAQEIIGKLVQL